MQTDVDFDSWLFDPIGDWETTWAGRQAVPEYVETHAHNQWLHYDNSEHYDGSDILSTALLSGQQMLPSIWAPPHTTGEVDLHGCSHPFCSEGFSSLLSFQKHVKSQHAELVTCAQCGFIAEDTTDLDYHARRTNHAILSCLNEDCDSKFSRLDVMKRHYLNHEPDVQRYPCPHCKKYKGKFGFKRKDHLTQHLRGYHHIGEDEELPTRKYMSWFNKERSCKYPDCPYYRGLVTLEGRSGVLPDKGWSIQEGCHAFANPSDWMKHMRSEHDESPFPCPVPGCSRVGGKGWFRKRDMVKHVGKEHPDFVLE